jgi:hypothetical protein
VSKILRVSYVVEGTTDFIVLDALIEKFLGGIDYVPRQIQPPTSEYTDNQGTLGGGWKGVLRWCAQTGTSPGGFAKSLPLLNCDCLVIHVDADIAAEVELQSYDLTAPCPSAKDTCDKIHAYLTNLIGNPLPSKVVLCIPAQCTEAWVFAALHPDLITNFQPIECRSEPETLLIGKPDKLVRDKDGRARKEPQRYTNAANRIAKGWSHTIAICSEAYRFETDCRAVLLQ